MKSGGAMDKFQSQSSAGTEDNFSFSSSSDQDVAPVPKLLSRPRKFLDTWMSDPLLKGWLVKKSSPSGEFGAYCSLCKCMLKAKSGKADILQHGRSSKHMKISRSTEAVEKLEDIYIDCNDGRITMTQTEELKIEHLVGDTQEQLEYEGIQKPPKEAKKLIKKFQINKKKYKKIHNTYIPPQANPRSTSSDNDPLLTSPTLPNIFKNNSQVNAVKHNTVHAESVEDMEEGSQKPSKRQRIGPGNRTINKTVFQSSRDQFSQIAKQQADAMTMQAKAAKQQAEAAVLQARAFDRVAAALEQLAHVLSSAGPKIEFKN